MKKSYIKLLIFESILCIIFFLNSFVWNILSKHSINIFLFITVVIFKITFGLEKDRHRFTKDIIMDIIIFLMTYYILFYLFGIITTFAKTGNYYTIKGIVNFIIPVALFIILKEYLRYNMMCKSEGNSLTTCFGIVVFILMDIYKDIYYSQLTTSYEIFKLIALTILPATASNIAFTYITKKVGYKPVILYALVTNLFYYLVPVIPNPSEYLTSVISFILPIILWYRVYKFFKKEKDEEIDRNDKKRKSFTIIVPLLITIILVYFTSGYFHYWAIAVASGSMSPVINKGDVVIIEKIDKDYSKIKKGDVIAYRYSNVAIVHRVINIVKTNDKYYFYTKGDANKNEDDIIIEEDMIIGLINTKIPLIGIPTVWLNEI